MSTVFHAQYYAHELTRRFSSDKLEKLSQSLFNATVDLNPHQIEAALFAFRSPLSRGAILADEVGLGKTIEAGLIISQLWAERKRRILIILPAGLREQWSRELLEKFFITSIILESKNFRQLLKQGHVHPFDQADTIILCSYHFARAKAQDILTVPWDLVVVDEAHRLRNVYRKDNKIARTLLTAIGNRPKVLLTATPLQNSLMELYGLVSFIDPHLFGSEDSFRSQYARRASEMSREEFQALRARVQPVCHRTLRRQVVEYIRYTNRTPITQDFTPSAEEERLYNAVSTYLQREESYALPSGQRALMTLVLRKILASSSFAIANTLGSLIHRLETYIAQTGAEGLPPMTEVLAEDYESIAETQEEWEPSDSSDDADEDVPLAEPAHAIRQEVAELRQYKTLAESITHNAKGEALLLALKKGFATAAQSGAPAKALIFTESRRTQSYLQELLQTNGYAGSIVTLNGTNNDPDALHIYRNWLQRHVGQDVITGSKSVDIRVALVEEFRDRAAIMIATESGAEGINLQFCSLVVNYDLPWNPQRIEQRIGRCHRYGQNHDVVVINFLNRKNAADQRVFELLAEKFRLFDGVFGASDEVLGAIESGVDFEKRIHEIYQSSRTPEAITRAFDQLQLELEEQITAQLQDTRAKLLENFDADVHTRLRLHQEQTTQQITRFEEWLWRLTQYELADCAFFDPNGYTFDLKRLPAGIRSDGIALGPYRLITHKNGTAAHHFRLGHPLTEHVLARAKGRPLPVAEVTFRRYLTEVEGHVPWTWWSHDEVGHTDAAKKEMHALFGKLNAFDTPKPERLLHRVLEIGSDPGDLILDSFAGSGTTGAVAHKMGRRWIMVELGEHCLTHILPRLKKVIDDKDPGGITEAVNWEGGGGFRYYRLGPSLIVEDAWGNPIINPALNAAMLAEAMCKLEGFTYAPSEDVFWMHGHSTEQDFLYVTTQFMSKEMLTRISDEVGPNRSLLICCTAFRCNPSQFPNLTLKKIPNAVLTRCEWGKDDYSLAVAHLPPRPMEPGTQTSLFEEAQP